MSDAPSEKSILGHVAHYERLIAEWTHRRDHGDCVPDAETLTRWIEQAKVDLKPWKARAPSDPQVGQVAPDVAGDLGGG